MFPSIFSLKVGTLSLVNKEQWDENVLHLDLATKSRNKFEEAETQNDTLNSMFCNALLTGY